MKIKICGLFRDEDIDSVNKARPDYAGFVFAKSPRQVSAVMAQYLRFRLANGIEPVGVFVNAPVKFIAELYKNETISIAQLHGDEDDTYIARLKDLTNGIPVIKAIKIQENLLPSTCYLLPNKADFLLLDSGSGTGKQFDWNILKQIKFNKPWFLAGGINIKNIEEAMKLKPYCIDVSSGAETDGLKDSKKILELCSIAGKIPKKPDNLYFVSTTQINRNTKRIAVNKKD